MLSISSWPRPLRPSTRAIPRDSRQRKRCIRRRKPYRRKLFSWPLTSLPNLSCSSWATLAKHCVRDGSIQRERLNPHYIVLLGFDPAVPGVYRKTKVASALGSDNLAKDQRVYLDLGAINRDATKFASPDDVVPSRPATAYTLLQADGVFKILGEEFVYGTAATVLQAVFSLKNVRRAPGKTGTLRR